MEEKKGKYLNPKADLTFKKVFGEHEDLVMSLLNALLPLDEGKRIEQVKFLTSELVPENPGKKNSTIFVRCKKKDNSYIFVEIQRDWNNTFLQHVELNASKAVVKQLGTSEDYSLLQPVYALNLINDVGFDARPDEFYHDYAIVNVEHSDRIIEGLRFIFVELPKFKPQTIKEKKMMVLWLRFLTEIDRNTEEAPIELLENPETAKALQILEKSAYNEQELRAYEYYWDAVYNERGAIRHGYKQGLAQGMAQGMAQGIERGIERGMAQGIERANRENALKMKTDGMPVELIAKYTGLDIETVNSL